MSLTAKQQAAVEALSIATNEIPSLLRKGIDLGDLFVAIFSGQVDPLNPIDGVLDVIGDLAVTGDANAKSLSMENSAGVGTISWLKDASIVGGSIDASVASTGRIESGGGGFAGGIVSVENGAGGYIFAEGTPQSNPGGLGGFEYGGNMAFGTVGAGESGGLDGTGYIKAYQGSGNVAFGKVQMYAASPGEAGISSSWYGTMAFGYAYNNSTDGDAHVKSVGHGNLAFGKVVSTGGVGAGNALIKSFKYGNLAFGYCEASDTGGSTIETEDFGSLAFGKIKNATDRFIELHSFQGSLAFGNIVATGAAISGTNFIQASYGSFAGGILDVGTLGLRGVNKIEAGTGSFAMGKVKSRTIENSYIKATGGAFAFGYTADDETIIAAGKNTAQFFPGTNAEINSLSVGTGPRLNGDGVPGVLRDGDVWVAANYTYIRSNGVSVKIV